MLFSMDLPNILSSKSSSTTFQVRIGPYFSIMIMLALMFVIPHDPSTSLEEVGSEAYRLTPRYVHKQQHATSDLSQHDRHATPKALSSATLGTLLTSEHIRTEQDRQDLARILRLARKRPSLVLKIARAALIEHYSSHTLPANYTSSSLGWATDVEELRAEYGVAPWWGDLTPSETRALYHALLPKRCAHAAHAYVFLSFSLRACVRVLRP